MPRFEIIFELPPFDIGFDDFSGPDPQPEIVDDIGPDDVEGDSFEADGDEGDGAGDSDGGVDGGDPPTVPLCFDEYLGNPGVSAFNDVVQRPNGLFLAVGHTPLSNPPDGVEDVDGYVVELNGSGVISKWATFDGTSAADTLTAVTVTDDGFVVVGQNAPVATDGGSLGEHSWAMSFAGANDDLQWSRVYGLSGGQREVFEDVAWAEGDAGGFVVVGESDAATVGMPQAWIMRLDFAGDEVWSARLGSGGEARFNAVAPAADGGYVAFGSRMQPGPDGTPRAAGWLVKFDVDGNTMWSQTLTALSADVRGWDIRVHPGGTGFGLVAGNVEPTGDEDLRVYLVAADGFVMTERLLSTAAPVWNARMAPLDQGGWALAGTVGAIEGSDAENAGDSAVVWRLNPGLVVTDTYVFAADATHPQRGFEALTFDETTAALVAVGADTTSLGEGDTEVDAWAVSIGATCAP